MIATGNTAGVTVHITVIQFGLILYCTIEMYVKTSVVYMGFKEI